MDPDPYGDPDPALFIIDLQDEGTFTSFSKIKSQKEATKQ
jgi:hypothetical protein